MTEVNSERSEVCIVLSDIDPVRLLGQNDKWLRLIRRRTDAKIVARGDELRIFGEPGEVHRVESLFLKLIRKVRDEGGFNYCDLEFAMDESERIGSERQYDPGEIVTPRKIVRPRTAGQKRYLEAMMTADIVFGIGPAGTGKTYLATAVAVSALSHNEVRRIIFVRPAVEAGEKLGYLPGDLRDKVDPYLRPLYDAMYDLLPLERAKRLMRMEAIEIVPLAFMRGRTLNECFVILDEAQNTTPIQMKMFLTRLGNGSKAAITGDVTQIDLEEGRVSGLLNVRKILQGVEGVAFVNLTRFDVVRHPLVQKIVEAYEKSEDAT